MRSRRRPSTPTPHPTELPKHTLPFRKPDHFDICCISSAYSLHAHHTCSDASHQTPMHHATQYLMLTNPPTRLPSLTTDDDSNNLDLKPTSTSPPGAADPAPIPAKTTWTLLLYLTGAADGACAGGETVFFTRDRPDDKEAVAVAPEAGMLLLHKHGEDCMLVRFVPLLRLLDLIPCFLYQSNICLLVNLGSRLPTHSPGTSMLLKTT